MPGHAVSMFDPEIVEGKGPSEYLNSGHLMRIDWDLVLHWRGKLQAAIAPRIGALARAEAKR
jgi:hypothetical protein